MKRRLHLLRKKFRVWWLYRRPLRKRYSMSGRMSVRHPSEQTLLFSSCRNLSGVMKPTSDKGLHEYWKAAFKEHKRRKHKTYGWHYCTAPTCRRMQEEYDNLYDKLHKKV